MIKLLKNVLPTMFHRARGKGVGPVFRYPMLVHDKVYVNVLPSLFDLAGRGGEVDSIFGSLFWHGQVAVNVVPCLDCRVIGRAGALSGVMQPVLK